MFGKKYRKNNLKYRKEYLVQLTLQEVKHCLDEESIKLYNSQNMYLILALVILYIQSV